MKRRQLDRGVEEERKGMEKRKLRNGEESRDGTEQERREQGAMEAPTLLSIYP